MSETRPVLVVMGVSGSGKSTVAGLLAERLGWKLQEGDDLHPRANVAKMAAGEPLNDDDRWPWLEQVGSWIRARTTANEPGVITCSALRRRYRDRLRGVGVVFVLLTGDRTTIAGRLTVRQGHYMPPSLLNSQMSTLEPPDEDENVLTVEIAGSAGDISDSIITRLGLTALPTTDEDTP